MTQTIVRARCERCHKAYRVPDPEHRYACRACGGIVTARASARVSPEIPGTITCAACHAICPGDECSCAECGAVLAPDATLHRSEESAAARREATEALKRGHAWIAVVTWFYRLGALAYAVATLLAILALARREQVPLEAGVLVVGLTTLLSILMAVGAIQILFKPFAWALVIALLAAAVSAVHFVGPNPLGLARPLSVLSAAACWLALWPTWRFRRLIAEHKDRYILHHSSGKTRHSLQGHTPEERHERLLAVMHRAGMRAWRVSLTAAMLILLASAIGTWGVVTHGRPRELSTALAPFERAWNAGSFERAVLAMPEEARAERAPWLARVAEGYGWNPLPPPAREATVHEADGNARVTYDLGGVPLATRWVLDGLEWSLTRIELPPPPLAPVLESFRSAWGRGDTRAVARLFHEDQDLMREAILRSVERRGWEPLPTIVETRVEEALQEGIPVAFVLADGAGELPTRWFFRDDARWVLVSLQFPPLRKG